MASICVQDEKAFEEWILSIIDQLRHRKARPDLERICHFVERKHGLHRKQTETQLEKLVDNGTVIKVMYKRGTSYRNAKNTKGKKRTYVSNVLNSTIASQRISEAVTALLEKKRNASGSSCETESRPISDSIPLESYGNAGRKFREGVSSTEIELWLSNKFGNEVLGQDPIHWMLQREVDAGNLKLLFNGNFLPERGRHSESEPESPTPQVTPPGGAQRPTLQKSISVVSSKRGRPPKRKHPHMGRSFSWSGGPEVKSPEEAAQSVPDPIMHPSLCDFCQKTSDSNRFGQFEELLFCKDCNAKAHPSCMNYSAELATRARKTNWQCIDCKICCVCDDPGEADCMLFCDACDKGYHMQCHSPAVINKPQGKWVCNDCVMDGVDIDNIDDLTSGLVDSTVRTDSESISSHRNGDRPETMKKPEVIYPDASNWSVEDVINFFEGKGFKDQAVAFQDQEIDGQSLLLLKRSDVLQGLSLRLGPALKIYNHVMKLQSAGHLNNS